MARRLSVLAGCLLLAACPGPRDDDALEPNDTFAEATRLTLGVPVEGRANQDNPDVFVVAAGPAATLRFTLDDRGLENCPVFRVHDPAKTELVGQDPASDCGVSPADTRFAHGASIEERSDGGYVITVPAEAEGDYFLTIIEDSEADNTAPFSWDYRLTATVP